MKNFKLHHEGTRIYHALIGVSNHMHVKGKRMHSRLSLVARLVFLVAVGLSAASTAHAACTPSATVSCLADQPIRSVSTVKPNVMFVLDNSGSMAWDIMSIDTALSDDANENKRCRRNYQYNSVYYNPNINYTAAVPKKPNSSTGAMESMGSQSFTNAKNDPFANPGACTSSTCTDLSKNFKAVSSENGTKAYYYKYIGSGSPGATCAADGNYAYVEVSATSCVVDGKDVKSCPTGADERENFANWYSYNRTRILMMKSGMASAFSTIDDKFRVGFHTINNPASTGTAGGSLIIKDFSGGASGTPKGDWYAMLFKMVPGSGTPLQNALDRVGQYYSGQSQTGLPVTSSTDPVQYSCQKNFTILSTDGYWNSNSTNRGNLDKTVPSTMPIRAGKNVYDAADTGLAQGAQFPRPYYEGSSASSNSLADIAMYYWINDLRTGTGGVSDNNVPTTPGDPAYWQHMNTFTIGLGVDGQLDYPSDLDGLKTGDKNWPVPAADTLSAVDDLWHAALNGRGQYYKASDPSTLANSLTSALKAIEDEPTYGVGPASSTNDYKSPDQNDFTTYVTSYRVINWSGDVNKYNVDRSTGLKTGSPLWSADRQLDRKVNPGLTSNVDATAYTTRNIVTRHDDGSTIPFTYASLSAAQRTALCYKASPGTGSCAANDPSLVNYLRGDATYEGDYGYGNSRFRNRQDKTEINFYKRNLLGSIVNAAPAYVAVAQEIYQDASDPGFSTFKESTKTRARTLYVPANDGMVHAFDAATGNELWAYIPSFLIPQANDENGKEKGLRALSYQDGGAPPYNQHFYIDATPVVGAVDFARTGGPISAIPTNTSSQWRDIMVGGLGKGGKGYYALDVTSPATTMAAAQSAVLWEFPSAADNSHSAVISGGQMGYSFGKPIIAKTYAYGWVVIVPSGYNNSDGFGYLFVLNARTGRLLETLKTTAAAPGMAYVTMLANSTNKYVIQAYAGDLNGNLWRFDFGQTPLTPRVARIFTSSTDTPIGSEVNVSVDGNTGYRWIFFGTGQYLDVGDRATTGSQYLVALHDGEGVNPNVPRNVVQLSDLPAVSDLMTGVGSGAADGWKYLLPHSGERLVVKPFADLRTVAFTSLIPTTNACSPETTGYLYGLEYDTGITRLIVNGNLVQSVYSSSGISGISMQITGKSTNPAGSGEPQGVIYTPDGQQIRVKLDSSRISSGTRHVGWRELTEEY